MFCVCVCVTAVVLVRTPAVSSPPLSSPSVLPTLHQFTHTRTIKRFHTHLETQIHVIQPHIHTQTHTVGDLPFSHVSTVYSWIPHSPANHVLSHAKQGVDTEDRQTDRHRHTLTQLNLHLSIVSLYCLFLRQLLSPLFLFFDLPPFSHSPTISLFCSFTLPSILPSLPPSLITLIRSSR